MSLGGLLDGDPEDKGRPGRGIEGRKRAGANYWDECSMMRTAGGGADGVLWHCGLWLLVVAVRSPAFGGLQTVAAVRPSSSEPAAYPLLSDPQMFWLGPRQLLSLWQQQPGAASSGNQTGAGGGSADPATLGSAFEAAKVRHLATYHNGALADFMNGEVRLCLSISMTAARSPPRLL